MTKEINIQNTARKEASKELDMRLFNNPRGLAYKKNGEPVKYGLGPNGASDTIGFTVVEITPEMIGRKLAIFTAIEFKRDRKEVDKWFKSSGKREVQQRGFVDAVNAQGGISGVACETVDLRKILDKFLTG